MTWNYGGNPNANDRDKVRFLIGDTDSEDQLIQNEEIEYLLNESPNVYLAAAQAAEQISFQFARSLSRRSQDLTPQTIDKIKRYDELAKNLRRQAFVRKVKPYAGGISKADKHMRERDRDRIPNKFDINTMRNPEVGAVRGDDSRP